MITDDFVHPDLLESMVSNNQKTIREMALNKPVMLIFLRHFGCIFCKEALTDISMKREAIEAQGVDIVFVHMSVQEVAERYFNKFNLKGVTHVSDPECKFYTAFGLLRGNFSQLFGLRVWMRGFSVQVKGNLPEHSKALGDSFQMPGVFVIQGDEIKNKYVHRFASDRPDYKELADCGVGNGNSKMPSEC